MGAPSFVTATITGPAVYVSRISALSAEVCLVTVVSVSCMMRYVAKSAPELSALGLPSLATVTLISAF